MKKNNKGFVLLETLMVSTFIITVLIYLYIQFSSVEKSYYTSFKYDTIQSLYSLKEVDKFINDQFGYNDFKNAADQEENRYIELYNSNKCSVINFPGEYSYCEKLMENLNIKTLLFVSNDISYLKTKLKTNNPYSNNLYLYLKNIDSNIANNSYILLAEFKDNTYSILRVAEKAPKCKRATKLHTEICSRDDSNGCRGAGYSKDDKITYGNLGTKGTLTSGDAFDCDVNGDGKYDSKTERFYYVSNYFDTEAKDFNDKYAVLIYYNNTTTGAADNINTYSYNTENKNNLGPVSLLNHLPSSNLWKNINLLNDNRQILTDTNLDETEDGKIIKFEYKNKAARLITYHEIDSSCNNRNNTVNSVGSLDNKCLYMLENTKFSSNSLGTYGSWTETPSSNKMIWNYQSNTRRILNGSYSTNSTDYGVRPVIEVHKDDIEY